MQWDAEEEGKQMRKIDPQLVLNVGAFTLSQFSKHSTTDNW
jgi:hypothetical protein